METLSKARILIFGGTGSLGQALISRLVENNTLMVYSRDEAKHWTLRNRFNHPNLLSAVGDIRDANRVERVTLEFQPTMIIMAAALKQVDTCETAPLESIQTNIMGINNIVSTVERHSKDLKGLSTVMMVSTDKACAPVNVYGMCKAIAERVVTSSGHETDGPKFVGVRYGNVLESRGSIIPLFRHQAENAPAFTLTHPDMTRFVMTLDQSIDLILATASRADTGEIWLPRLRSMAIGDLADIFSERYGKPVNTIGMRPGEKLHEALINETESVRIVEDGEHFRMRAAHSTIEHNPPVFGYQSNDDVMSKDELQSYLESLAIFDRRMSEFVGREIEEIASPAA